MILVTGAGGKTGNAILKALKSRGKSARAFIKSSKDYDSVVENGANEIIVGDMMDPAALAQAMQNINAVYLICPNMFADEFEMAKRVIQSAQNAGVEQLVYHSVLHPQVQAMPHHWNKMRVEEFIFSSGMNFTILQPTAYMQNMLAYWEQITENGIFALPYAPESRLSLVDLDDVASVAGDVLGEQVYFGATFELAGTYPLSQHEVAAKFEAVLDRKVRASLMDRDDWRIRMQTKISEYAIETLHMMFEYYERHGLVGNPMVLKGLLGRAPTSLEELIERYVKTKS